MRLLCVQPGATFSTSDVYDGIISAMRERGHECIEYNLSTRYETSDNYLSFLHRHMLRKRRRRINLLRAQARWDDAKALESEALPDRPQAPDAIRHASMGMLEAVVSGNRVPEWVLAFSGMFMHPDVLIGLHRFGVPIALILTESPYDDAKQGFIAAFASVVFTNERRSVDILRRERFGENGERIWGNRNTFYLPHAIDPNKHAPELANETDVPAHDVVFVGTGFFERQELLAAVRWDRLGVDFGLYGGWPFLGHPRKGTGRRAHLRDYLRGGITPNAFAAALYRKAKIGLNLHRQSVGISRNATRLIDAESMNPRDLELAANGCVFVSDARAELIETFDDLVPTFEMQRTPVSADVRKAARRLEERISALMDDPERRAYIATELPGRVAGMTFDVRAEQIERTIVQATALRHAG